VPLAWSSYFVDEDNALARANLAEARRAFA
jgi:hypothetical protein